MSMRRVIGAVAAALLVCVGLAACSSDGSSDVTRKTGGKVTFAQLPQSAPNYIFPLAPPGQNSISNVEQFQALMFRPLYWLGKGAQIDIDPELSLAEKATWNADNDSVTLRLKDWEWSDGTKLGRDNIMFWVNLLRANKKEIAFYAEGQFPDDLKSVDFDEKTNSVTFNLTAPVNPDWFVYNHLARFIPLPTAWDRTENKENAGCATADPAADLAVCKDVFAYLTEKAKSTKTYATDPLWQVVNGPFKLATFSAGGHFTMVPNEKYSGSIKPAISEFESLPFTDEAAEYNALRTGKVDVGYAPTNVLPPKSTNASAAASPVKTHDLDVVQAWGFSYVLINFNNPKSGSLLGQLYARQALQSVINQKLYVEKAANGYGKESWGPVPVDPPSAFTKGMDTKAPYPFDVKAAREMLTSHGWEIPASGPAICKQPGSGDGQCGVGVEEGTSFRINLLSYTSATAEQEMAQFVADASKAGIELVLKEVPPQQMVAQAVQCKSSDSKCDWELINYGSWILKPYPSGEALFKTDAGTNIGSYSDPQMDSLIDDTLGPAGKDPIAAYATYAAEQIPVLWVPTIASPVFAINKKLDGVSPLNSLYRITPEKWAFKE